MRIVTLSVSDAAEIAVEQLGLGRSEVGLDYPEAVHASVRRAASFLCPTTPRALVDAVREVLTPLLGSDLSRDELVEAVERLISIGDLLELGEAGDEKTRRMLYLGPPCFVEIEVGRYLVTGIRPLGQHLVDEDLALHYEAHTRVFTGSRDQLIEAGLREIKKDRWIGKPSSVPYSDYLADYSDRLDVARQAGHVEGLQVIDKTSLSTYYKGRWREPSKTDTGDFVGRRPQAYGADLWCVIRLEAGQPLHLLDLPVLNAVAPARDEAWRVQAAFDAQVGFPQLYRVRELPGASSGSSIVDFFSPLPSWSERYLGLVGLSVERSQGALFSYRIPNTVVTDLSKLLADTLWMSSTIDRNDP